MSVVEAITHLCFRLAGIRGGPAWQSAPVEPRLRPTAPSTGSRHADRCPETDLALLHPRSRHQPGIEEVGAGGRTSRSTSTVRPRRSTADPTRPPRPRGTRSASAEPRSSCGRRHIQDVIQAFNANDEVSSRFPQRPWRCGHDTARPGRTSRSRRGCRRPTDHGQPFGRARPGRSASGPRPTTSNCSRTRPTRPGPTRSRPGSGRCAASSWAPRTIATTRRRPGGCRTT